MFSYLQKLIHIASQFLFPLSCVGCRKFGQLLCENCAKDLTPAESDDPRLIAALSYRDPLVRALIWQMKYRGASEATDLLAGYLLEAILKQVADDINFSLPDEPIILIPIPMTRSRRRRRGWNQTDRLAQAIAHLSPAGFTVSTDSLIKIKNTPAQVSLKSRGERLRNLNGAFALLPRHSLAGRVVCLIDDVATTGTTLQAAAREVSRARPRLLLTAVVASG